MTRNALYFVCPLESAGASWRENISLLKRWGKQFDGKRSLCVVQGRGTEPLAAVLRELKGFRVDSLLVRENDPLLRETAHWLELLETVKDCQGITWFGHTKGVNPFFGKPTTEWMRACYETTLSRPEKVDASLASKMVCGPFRMEGKFWPDVDTQSAWVFAGTYFWFRNDALFERNWKRVENHRWGVEAYPSVSFSYTESVSLFQDGSLDLYNHRTWATYLRSELEKWRASP